MRYIPFMFSVSFMLLLAPTLAEPPIPVPSSDTQFYESFNGNEMLKSCTALLKAPPAVRREEDALEVATGLPCLFYTAGFMHGYQLGTISSARQLRPFCLPENAEKISGEQFARIIVKWAEEHPEKLHESSIVIMTGALNRAFPCK